MAAPVSVLAAGVSAAGAPAASKITVNSRVTAAAGPVGVIADVIQFSAPGIGSWVVGATRVQVMGMPIINQSSTGPAVGPPPVFPPLGPMTVTQGDPRVGGL
jgi:hypothetical protein